MKKLKLEIKNLRNEMVDNIQEYRENVLDDYGIKSKKAIIDECGEIVGNCDEYEDFYWEMGYVYAMQEVLWLLNKNQIDSELSETEQFILDKEGEEALGRYQGNIKN